MAGGRKGNRYFGEMERRAKTPLEKSIVIEQKKARQRVNKLLAFPDDETEKSITLKRTKKKLVFADDVEFIDPVLDRSPNTYEGVVSRGAADKIQIPAGGSMRGGIPKDEWEEQQVAKVEVLMIQGFKEERLVRQMMNQQASQKGDQEFSKLEIARFVNRVHARWEVLGSGNDLRRQRGEEMARLAIIETKLWVILSNLGDNSESAKDKMWVITMLNSLASDRCRLNGLTDDTIKQCMQAPEDSEYANRIKKQKGLASMAGRMLEIISQRRRELAEGDGIVDV